MKKHILIYFLVGFLFTTSASVPIPLDNDVGIENVVVEKQINLLSVEAFQLDQNFNFLPSFFNDGSLEKINTIDQDLFINGDNFLIEPILKDLEIKQLQFIRDDNFNLNEKQYFKNNLKEPSIFIVLPDINIKDLKNVSGTFQEINLIYLHCNYLT